MIIAPNSALAQKSSTGTNADSIGRMIELAIQTGKKDTMAAALIFKEAIAKANNTDTPYLAGKAYYEMAQMFFAHKIRIN